MLIFPRTVNEIDSAYCIVFKYLLYQFDFDVKLTSKGIYPVTLLAICLSFIFKTENKI